MEIALNIMLIKKLHAYHKKKLTLGKTSRKHILKKGENNKIILALVMCFISTVTHLLSFFTFMFLKFGYMYSAVLYIGMLPILVNDLRHACNFFIFFLLNKKFKERVRFKIKIEFNSFVSICQVQTPVRRPKLPKTVVTGEQIQLDDINNVYYCTKL